MAERMVRFSDLSGQMADAEAGGLIPLVVTDYPDADPDQRVRIEVTPTALKNPEQWLLVSGFWLMVTGWLQVDSGVVMVPGRP